MRQRVKMRHDFMSGPSDGQDVKRVDVRDGSKEKGMGQ
jgi:hypothetical protein